MSSPNVLSPSPVHLAFTGIQWDPLGKLELSDPEKSLLRSAEDNVFDYCLAETEDAAAYARVLLKVLDQVTSGPNSSYVDKVAKLSLQDILEDQEALQMLYVDPMGVVTHYALTKLYEVILYLKEKRTSKSNLSVVSTFYKDGSLIEEWRPLLRILRILKGGGTGDPFAQRESALCLGFILFEGCPSQQKKKTHYLPAMTQSSSATTVMEALQSLVSWIASRLQSSETESLAMVMPVLSVLIYAPEAQKLFDQAGGIGYLVRHLRVRQTRTSKKVLKGASVQQLYELCFCLWIMTYECNSFPTIRNHFHRDDAVAALCDLVAASPREKVVRVAFSSLRNLATCEEEGSNFLGEMIGCGLMKSIDLMNERQWTDPDIVEDLKFLHKLLHENYKERSRWDVYKTEIESRHLQWGIVHTEKFFRENARMMEGKDGNFGIVKLLISLAASASENEEVAAIACFDIGEFVRNYPNGRAIVRRIRGKEIVMSLIEHENPELQRHALQCISKILVNNWRSVGE